ncbi:hypothetical protein NBM05_12815, partial [Rothia sp. AR01]|nr:hypothetical protein [Rothia santali]
MGGGVVGVARGRRGRGSAPGAGWRVERGVLPQIPELRTAFVVASQYNLVTAAWLRELDDVVRFEAALESA